MPDKKRRLISKFLRKSARAPKDLTMRQVLSVSKKRRIPSFSQWKQLPRVLNGREKLLFAASVSLVLLSLISLGGGYVWTHRITTPAVGGSYTEALIGAPQFINPLYASASDVDSDLAKLVYSGLMRWDPENGLEKDLAASVEISEDQKTYTITLRDDVLFHNGDPLHARDVVFTYTAIQNPQYRSPLAGSFQNVSITQVSDDSIAFALKEPSASFLSQLTTGILPATVWGDIPAKNVPLAALNLEPIGTGPYRFEEFSKDKKGTVLSYTLKRHEGYYEQGPLIKELVFKFYADAQAAVSALKNRHVEGASFIPAEQVEEIKKERGVKVHEPTMNRSVTLFFNQTNAPILENEEVRKAITQAIDKEALVNTELQGTAIAIDSPVLPGMLGEYSELKQPQFDPKAANEQLEEAGYPLPEESEYRQTSKTDEDPLTLTLTTAQNAEFTRISEAIAEQLKEVGIKIEINAVPAETLFSEVITPHDYELLLTGTLLGVDPDPYLFWHSSQAQKGGLNLSLYKNDEADKLLEEARSTTDSDIRAEKYRAFQEKIIEDLPAVFLYRSTYAYAVADKIKEADVPHITTPSDRFANITEWYIKTKYTLR